MTFRRLLLIFPVLLCGVAGISGYAQSTNAGDIRGTVTDPTGALIPGVTVTVLNIDTGVTKDFVTNDSGLYDTSSIVAGNYKVTFKSSGFETVIRGPITVEVGFTTVNGQLRVGSANEVVAVTTDVPLLNTESGDQTSTLSSKDMAQLPNVGGSNGPDWQNFMILLPGAAGTPMSNSGSSNPGMSVSTNGNLPFSNVLADGASTTLPSSQNANPAAFEDVDELQVSLSSFSAQYGVGGLIINQITKGGSAKYHGSAYEYFQNDALNAANFGFGNKVPVSRLRYDDFGGTISGPILKKKMFFFFGYDQIVNNGVQAGYNTVPTAANMAGIFGSDLLYDPTTQTYATDGAGNTYPVRKSFLSEYGVNQVPQSLMDPVALKYQQYYPTESSHIPYGHFVPAAVDPASGVAKNNFYSAYAIPRPWKRFFGRLDYDITPNNRLTISDTQGNELENGDNSIVACPIACQLGDVDNNNAQITDVWNISPHTINEARMGYTSQLNFFSDAASGKGVPGSLGWQFAKADVLPAVNYTRNNPYGQPVNGNFLAPGTNAQYKEFVFDPSDVVTMIRGKHVLHFGGEFAIYRDDATPWGNLNSGSFQFSGVYTEQWTLQPNAQGVLIGTANSSSTGEEYADFLLGAANQWNAAVTPESGARLKKPQMFVQDDWKLRPNLTLNLGLRYEISHGFNEVKNNMASFDPTVINPATGTLGAYWFGETHANGRNSMQADVYSTVLPRPGFSWLKDSATTVRGGFGVYSYNFSLDNYGAGMGASVSSAGGLTDNVGVVPVTQFGGAGTTLVKNPAGGYNAGTALPYTAASTDPTRFNGQSGGALIYNPYHTPIPKIYQWNFGVERQLGTDYVATLTYVGSHGFNLTFPTDINAVPENEATSASDNQFRPYPIYPGPIGASGNSSAPVHNGISNYNSLQASITKRFTHGLSMNFNYVWSHFLDDQDSSGWGSHAGPILWQHASSLTLNQSNLNYGPSNFDIRNAFKGYLVYQLPFGMGKQFLNHSQLLDEAIGGWQLSGTIVESTGNPFTITGPGPLYTSANAFQYPSRISGVSTDSPGGKNWQHWYNPAAFAYPGAGVFGNVPRNSLVGPGLNVVDLSAGKTFSVTEGIKFGIRCDAQNAFNHPSFGPPTGNQTNLTGATGAGSPFTGPAGGVGSSQITTLTVDGRSLQLSARITF